MSGLLLGARFDGLRRSGAGMRSVRQGHVVRRLSEILQRNQLAPEQPEREAALKEARRALRKAEKAYASRVKERRRALAGAGRAHRRAVREAARELRAAERSRKAPIHRAEEELAHARTGQELARYGPFALFEDRIETPEGEVPVSRGIKAIVDTAHHLLQREQAVARLDTRPADLGALRALERRARRPRRDLHLLLETPRFVSVAPCKRQDARAREFAQRVNVAALNAATFARGRHEAIADAERALAQLREECAAAVERAKRKLGDVEADTAAVEEARRALAEAEAATAEIETRRSALRALEPPTAARG